jgi:hypothetical protein
MATMTMLPIAVLPTATTAPIGLRAGCSSGLVHGSMVLMASTVTWITAMIRGMATPDHHHLVESRRSTISTLTRRGMDRVTQATRDMMAVANTRPERSVVVVMGAVKVIDRSVQSE